MCLRFWELLKTLCCQEKLQWNCQCLIFLIARENFIANKMTCVCVLFTHWIELLTLMEKELKSLKQKWVVWVCKSLTRGNIKMYLSILQRDSYLSQLISRHTRVTALFFIYIYIYLFLCVTCSMDRKQSISLCWGLRRCMKLDISAVCVSEKPSCVLFILLLNFSLFPKSTITVIDLALMFYEQEQNILQTSVFNPQDIFLFKQSGP